MVKGNLPWDNSETSIPELLNLTSKNKPKFPDTIELEHKTPDTSVTVKEVLKCLEF
ncbi:hypothetical protein J2X69_003108 [Algoriphagus sp. 4150]|nr:hypothetical protein [Algoriphagus sp. 4150]